MLRVPSMQSDEELAVALLETKHIYIHPGHFFDFSGDGYLVVSLIAREEEFTHGAAEILSAF